MVSSSFTYCCKTFLFTPAVQWDIDVARFDLVPNQSLQ